jgi:outer membrane protein
MRIRSTVLAGFAALLAAPGVWAQAGTAAVAPLKIAVINLQAAIAGTAEGKQAAEEIRAQFAPRQTELQNLQKQIEDLQRRLQAGATTLSDDEKAHLQRQGNELSRRYQRESQDLTEDGNDAQQEAVNRIGQKMMAVLDKFAKANGYDLVLDTSSQSGAVVFWSNQADVTQQIVRLYDQAYPIKAAAPAAHPGTHKPPSQ